MFYISRHYFRQWRLFFSPENLIYQTHKGDNEDTKLDQIRICNIHWHPSFLSFGGLPLRYGGQPPLALWLSHVQSILYINSIINIRLQASTFLYTFTDYFCIFLCTFIIDFKYILVYNHLIKSNNPHTIKYLDN